MADNTCKYYKLVKQVSYNSGQTWSNVDPPQYQQGDLYESGSTDCTSGDTGSTACTPTYRYIGDVEECIFTDKFTYEKQQVSYDCGETWEYTSVDGNARCLETDSIDCGWVMPNMDGLRYYRVSPLFEIRTVRCDNSDHIIPVGLSATTAACDSTSAITKDDTKYYKNTMYYPYDDYTSGVHTFIIGNCVTKIDNNTFQYLDGGNGCGNNGQPNMHIVIPSSVNTIGGAHGAAFAEAIIDKLEWTPNSKAIFCYGENNFSCSVRYMSNMPTTFAYLGKHTFANASFGNIDTITFDKKVALEYLALAGCPFKTIIFNNGFSKPQDQWTSRLEYNANALDYTNKTELIILNGKRSNYPSNYLENIINSTAVIQDNTIE